MFGQDKGNDTAADGVAGSVAASVVGRKRATRNRPKKYDTQELKTTRDKEMRQKRAAAKAGLEERFLTLRASLEKRRKWVGPRKFGEWIRGLAERELGQAEACQSGSSSLMQLQTGLIANMEKQLAIQREQLAEAAGREQIMDDYIETKWQKKMDYELARRPPPEIE